MVLLERAAGQGHAYAMSALGQIHSERKLHAQAVEWQGLTLVHFSAQREHFCRLHTSTWQCVVSTSGGLRWVFESQKSLRLSWKMDASCGLIHQTGTG